MASKTKLKDNKLYRIIVIPLCILMCLFGRFVPAFDGMSQNGMGVIFIFIGSLILWFTIGIDWPSILCIFSIAILPDIGFNSIISGSFGSEVFVFLMFTFIITYGLSKTPFIKRVAIGFVTSNLARKNGKWFTIMFLTSVLILGLFMSPTVLFFIMLPILEEIFNIVGIKKGEKIAKVLILGLGFSVSLSSGMTTIAHAFPTLAINAAAKIAGLSSPNMFQYLAIAFPVGLLSYVFMLFMLFFFIKPDTSKLDHANVDELKKSLPKMDITEIVTLIIFGLVIVLWVVPGLFTNNSFMSTLSSYKTAFPPMLGALAMFIIHIKSKPILKVDDAFKNGVPWGSLVMCAGTLALGSGIKYGISDYLQNTFGPSLSNLPAIILLIIFITWAAIQTNLSSNMTTATVVSSVAATILFAIDPSPLNIMVVAILIGMMASFAFATPPSMPHIAIIGNGDYANGKDVLIYGSMLMGVTILFSLVIGYPIGLLVL